jgi:hypothetical protein
VLTCPTPPTYSSVHGGISDRPCLKVEDAPIEFAVTFEASDVLVELSMLGLNS